MSTFKEITSKSAKTAFDKKVLSAVQHLHPYAKHRIYIAETSGILPKNMYSSTGIIDESIIELYESDFDMQTEAMSIKLELFRIVDNYMNNLFKKEAYHKNTISTDTILQDELSKLKEDYTVDGDLDFVLNTDLSDISYNQDHMNHLYLYEDKETSILKAFELEDLSASQPPKVFGRFYHWLPINVSNIVDLHIFGNLNFEDIAKIKKIETTRIQSIFDKVKKEFRRNLE
jgi:hypothetical protein